MNNDERPDTMNLPEIIYLQVLDLDGDPTDEVTWCVDRIHESDIEYRRVRVDPASAAVGKEESDGP